MDRRFRFISGTYLAVALFVPLPLYALAYAFSSEAPWLTVLLAGIPLAIAIALVRRGYVSLALDGDRVLVRRGFGPRQTLVRPKATEPDFDPFRGADAPTDPKVRFETADHAEFETRTRSGRLLARFTRGVRTVFGILGAGSMLRLGEPVEVEVEVTELAFRDAGGRVRQVLLPTQGDANQKELEALRQALRA